MAPLSYWYYANLQILELSSVPLYAYYYTYHPRERKETSAVKPSTQGKLYLTGAFSLAGTSVVTGYLLSSQLSCFTITAVSMRIILAGLLPFYAGKTIRTIRKLNKRDWLFLVSQAFFGIFLFRSFLLAGVRLTSTAEAGILTGTTPAITAVMAYFILKERLTGYKTTGIAAAVLGILLLQDNSLFFAKFSFGHFDGNVLVLLAASSESYCNIISRKQKAAENENARPVIHPTVRTAFIWYGLAVTALSGMMPLTAMLLSMLFLHEQTTAVQWIGSGMIVLGMHLIVRKNRRKHAAD
ncbi:MAG: DMT family transporter [Clostridiales bacterium]|nr:DMT family transporter [Clostridiales bacterium]